MNTTNKQNIFIIILLVIIFVTAVMNISCFVVGTEDVDVEEAYEETIILNNEEELVINVVPFNSKGEYSIKPLDKEEIKKDEDLFDYKLIFEFSGSEKEIVVINSLLLLDKKQNDNTKGLFTNLLGIPYENEDMLVLAKTTSETQLAVFAFYKFDKKTGDVTLMDINAESYINSIPSPDRSKYITIEFTPKNFNATTQEVIEKLVVYDFETDNSFVVDTSKGNYVFTSFIGPGMGTFEVVKNISWVNESQINYDIFSMSGNSYYKVERDKLNTKKVILENN